MSSPQKALLLLLCALPLSASAGNQDLFGFGVRGPAMSGAMVAFPRGYESVYYNPAGLTYGGERTFSVVYSASVFQLEVLSPNPERLSAVADEDTVSGVTVGVNVILPMTGIFKDRIAIGVGLYVPTTTLLSARIPPPYTPQFTLVADRARSLSIQAALGVRIFDWLRIGGGVRVLAGLRGFIDAAPNAFGNLSSSVEDELVAAYAGTVGIVGRPHEQVSIGVVWRGDLGAEFSLPVTAELGDVPLVVPELQIAGETVWDPQQVAIHIGYQPMDVLSLEAGVTWKQWSAFPAPLVNTTAALPPQEPIDFKDTWVPRIGLETEHTLGAWRLAGRAGYAWEESPVGEQTGQHNFLDSDRHVVSAGLGFGWGGEGRFRVDLDLYAQLHIMETRRFAKTFADAEDAVVVTDNLGFPWIGARGTIWSFGAAIEVQL